MRVAGTADLMAQAIVNVTGVEAYITPALRSWHLGELIGQSVAKTAALMKRYMFETPDEPIPGGESFHAFVERQLRFIRPLWEYTGLAVIVAQGRNFMITKAWADAGAPQDELHLDTLLQQDITVKADLLKPGDLALIGPGQPMRRIR